MCKRIRVCQFLLRKNMATHVLKLMIKIKVNENNNWLISKIFWQNHDYSHRCMSLVVIRVSDIAWDIKRNQTRCDDIRENNLVSLSCIIHRGFVRANFLIDDDLLRSRPCFYSSYPIIFSAFSCFYILLFYFLYSVEMLDENMPARNQTISKVQKNEVK